MAVEKTVNVVFGQKGAAALTGNVTELNQGLELMQKLAAGVQKAFDFGKAGAQSLDIAKSFERMGRTAKDLEKLERALGGAVNTTRTQQLSNMGGAAGISADQMAKLAETARTTARIMGVDVEEAFTKVTQATTKLSARKLAAIGIIIDERKLYRELAVSLGVVEAELTDVQKRQALVNATIKAGQDLDPAGHTDSQAEAYQRLNTQLENVVSSMQEMASPILLDAMQGLVATLGALGFGKGDIAKGGGGILDAVNAAAGLRTGGGRAEQGAAKLKQLEARLTAAREKSRGFGRGKQEAFLSIPGLEKEVAAARSAVADLEEVREKAAEDRKRAQAEFAASSRTARFESETGGGKRKKSARTGGPGIPLDAEQGPFLDPAELAALQAGNEAAALEQTMSGLNEILLQGAEHFDHMAAAGDNAAEAMARVSEEQQALADISSGIMADGLAQAGEGMARAGVMALFYGASLKQGINQAMNAIFAEAATRSLFEFAAGWAALGWDRPDSAAKHFAASKGYAVVAAGTGIGALASGGFSAGGGGGGGGSGGGGFGSPDTRDFGGGGSGGNQTTVVNVSLKMDGRKVGQAVATARRGPAPPRGQD